MMARTCNPIIRETEEGDCCEAEAIMGYRMNSMPRGQHSGILSQKQKLGATEMAQQ